MGIDQIIAGFHSVNLSAYDTQFENLISIYDDIAFENYDYDIIPGPERNKIRKHLLNNNWTEHGSRRFTSPSGAEILLTKPTPTLGGNPADNLLEAIQSRSTKSFIITTPTQTLLAMIMSSSWNQAAASNLVSFHPANLDKIKQWVKNDGLTLPSQEDWNQILKFQSDCITKRKNNEMPKDSKKKFFKKEVL